MMNRIVKILPFALILGSLSLQAWKIPEQIANINNAVIERYEAAVNEALGNNDFKIPRTPENLIAYRFDDDGVRTEFNNILGEKIREAEGILRGYGMEDKIPKLNMIIGRQVNETHSATTGDELPDLPEEKDKNVIWVFADYKSADLNAIPEKNKYPLQFNFNIKEKDYSFCQNNNSCSAKEMEKTALSDFLSYYKNFTQLWPFLQFDLIAFDWSVFKFFTAEVKNYHTIMPVFRDMLKVGGKFYAMVHDRQPMALDFRGEPGRYAYVETAYPGVEPMKFQPPLNGGWLGMPMVQVNQNTFSANRDTLSKRVDKDNLEANIKYFEGIFGDGTVKLIENQPYPFRTDKDATPYWEVTKRAPHKETTKGPAK